ncbi:MAG: hypothetical protein HYT78_20895 [Deltaproteobacteria bacterium]|nr:hypothetical protein [Deltaproteobacteria bacterium]
MAMFRRLTKRELFIFVVFLVLSAGFGFVAFLESDVTPVWVTTQARISLSADGIGIFIWKAQGGFWADVANRRTVFDVSPGLQARIVSLNGRPVGKASGTETTDRSGRIVVVIKAEAEGPVTLKGVDLRTAKSATAVRWTVAD